MKHDLDNARRHAHNTLAEVNRHLDKGNIRNPQHHHMLTDMAEKATRTLENLDRLDNIRPYADTNIGFGAADRRRGRMDDVMRDAMDVVDRILPHLTDDRYDDMDDVEDRRGRPRTTRRGVGRWTTVRRHVRRMPRSDMDDRYTDDRYADDWDDTDDRYDDRYADDIEDARRGKRMPRRGRSGRFIRGDMDRYDDADDARMTADDARRAADDAMRTADEARRTAEQARRTADDMRHTDRTDRTDARYDDRRNDRMDDNRTDDRTARR